MSLKSHEAWDGFLNQQKLMSRNKKVDVMVFSKDSDFIEKATAKQQLMGERLDAPGDLPESAAGEWEDICELLYAASIVYGKRHN